jgi:hypothetical protein
MFMLHNTANASILKVANIFFGHCINISDMKKLGNMFTMKCILHYITHYITLHRIMVNERKIKCLKLYILCCRQIVNLHNKQF